MAKRVGQEPAQTPHWIHSRTLSPPGNFSTSWMKSNLPFLGAAAVTTLTSFSLCNYFTYNLFFNFLALLYFDWTHFLDSFQKWVEETEDFLVLRKGRSNWLDSKRFNPNLGKFLLHLDHPFSQLIFLCFSLPAQLFLITFFLAFPLCRSF